MKIDPIMLAWSLPGGWFLMDLLGKLLAWIGKIVLLLAVGPVAQFLGLFLDDLDR